MTKVVQIQYSTASGARSALRLQKAFIDAGLQSNIISLEEEHPLKPGISYLSRKNRFIARINMRLQNRKLKSADKKFGLFSIPEFSNNISQHPLIAGADVIYVHWVMNGFLNISNFEQLAKTGKPVIVVMHDMWNITGGCHYSFDCNNYVSSSCSNCQFFLNASQQKIASENFRKKQSFYNKYNNLYFVSPSQWLAQCAKDSILLKNKPVFYIPNVLDTTLFKSTSKTFARQVLNLNEHEIILAFGAVSVTSPYKGWTYLAEALRLLYESRHYSNVSVLVFGSNHNKDMEDAIPFKTRFMGYLGDEVSTTLVYNAADIFIVPSLADNQPTIIQESLSCGTPVVAFNTGGIPDMIVHKENGYLAAYKNAADLVEGIKYCLDNKTKGYRLPHFDTEKTISKHLQLFDYIKQTNAGHPAPATKEI